MQNRLFQDSTGTESSFAPNVSSLAGPMAAGTVRCSGMVVPAAWMAIYRLAYEQARLALRRRGSRRCSSPRRTDRANRGMEP